MNPFSIILFLLSLIIVFSCRKPKCDEEVPSIAFKEFRQYKNAQGNSLDSAKIIVTFKDCDGDLGLDDEDTLAPFDTASSYYYNFTLKYFEMVNGNWVGCPDNKMDSCYFRYRLPKMTPEGQSKILEGEFGITISPFYFNFMSPNSDTIKYEVRLYDRELHESNMIETPMILSR